MLGPAQLLQHLELSAPPRLISRQAQPAEDDLVDLFPDEQLGECELRFPGQRRNRVIPDAEQYAPGDRLFVVLDLFLDVEFVLVSKGARRSLSHSFMRDGYKVG